MPYDKDDFTVFPTREGGAQGSGVERVMLDTVGGANGIRTKIRTNPDGSTTRLRTRNGMPEFVTTRVTPTGVEEEVQQFAYMESGYLTWTFPGEGNPTRGDPATWRFADINPADEWLGKVSTTGAQQHPQPTPVDTGVLRDEIPSIAIGYTPSADAALDAARKTEAAGGIVSKKLTAGLFPASVFSGKMRLFMQSLYGAKEYVGGGYLFVDLVGTSAALFYERGDTRIQFGLWAHSSPGIFTAPDGTFWMLIITQPGGSLIRVQAYQIKQNAAGKALMGKRNTIVAGSSEMEKIEAYIFAHSYIDTDNGRVVGEYSPPANGGALAYGWKFNTDGSKASVVLVNTEGAFGDQHLKSYEVHLAFSYADGAIVMEGSYNASADWMDGWGSFNIFAPIDDTSIQLGAVSLAMTRSGLRPGPFNFSGVPVYGYYKDDVWTPVMLSRSDPSPGEYPKTTQEHSGLSFNSDVNMDEGSVYYYGFHPANQGFSYTAKTINDGMDMGISFGSFSVSGSFSFYAQWKHTLTVGAHGGPSAAFMNFYTGQIGGSGATYEGSDAAVSWIPADTHWVGSIYVGTMQGTYTYDSWGSTVRDYKVWTLVIPTKDAEAIYIATKNNAAHTSVTHSIKITPPVTQKLALYSVSGILEVTPWVPADTWGWFGDTGTDVTTYDTDPPPGPNEVSVFAFNKKIHGVAGTPSASYEPLFIVDRNSPYFNSGMTMRTSYGERYQGSEGAKDPSTLPTNPNFVGWA